MKTVFALFLTWQLWVGPLVAQGDHGLPRLRASSECFTFEASVQWVEGQIDAPEENGERSIISGACFGPQWFLTVRESGRAAVESRVCSDGERVWIRHSDGVTLEAATKQLAIPFSAWRLATLLQLGDGLEVPWHESKGRWRDWGIEPVVTMPSANARHVMFAWTSGRAREEYAYSFELVSGQWFWSGHTHAALVDGADGLRHAYFRSSLQMEDPIVVGSALCASTLRAVGWVADEQSGSGELKLARTTVSRLLSAEPMDRAKFNAALAAQMELQRGTKVLDRSRSATLEFVAGSSTLTFDGTAYVVASPIVAVPTDLELIALLRGAKLEGGTRWTPPSARIEESTRPDRVQPSSGSGGVINAASAQRAVMPSRKIDLGAIRFGVAPAKVQARFQITNSGDTPCVIKSIRASCGCADAKSDRNTIEPGGTATITATLTIERTRTYHSAIWLVFEDGSIERLEAVAIGVPDKAVRAIVRSVSADGDTMSIVMFATDGVPEGEVGVPDGAESMIASDSGWLPIGGDAASAKHWIRDIVQRN